MERLQSHSNGICMSTVVGEVIQLLKPLILPVSCMINSTRVNFPLHGISDIVSLPVCSVQFTIYLHMFHLVPVSKLLLLNA